MKIFIWPRNCEDEEESGDNYNNLPLKHRCCWCSVRPVIYSLGTMVVFGGMIIGLPYGVLEVGSAPVMGASGRMWSGLRCWWWSASGSASVCLDKLMCSCICLSCCCWVGS